MGNLAAALGRTGVKVGGSDGEVYPPISDLLAKESITVDSPDDVEALDSWRNGLFVVGNAVSRGHPQVEWLLRNPEVSRMSFPEYMGEYRLSRSRNLVVAGTHGKSTTTAAAAHYLRERLRGVGWFVGGVLADGLPALSFAGDDRYFVIEGDEYDSAFFDKRAKFVHYRPDVLLLNNLEFDHADIYRDLTDVQRAFRQVISLVPDNGSILFNGDDPRLRELLPVPWTSCLSFGEESGNDFVISREDGDDVFVRSAVEGFEDFRIRTVLKGRFNVFNIAGAVLGARLLDPALAEGGDRVNLWEFGGLKRRQEILYRSEDAILIEDFGHHPTALRATLDSLREQYPNWTLHAMVEPRSNTMKTCLFQDALVRALSVADRVSFAPIHRADTVCEKERLNLGAVKEALAEKGVSCRLCGHMEELPEAFADGLRRSRAITVVFSNGAFGGMIPQLRQSLVDVE